MESQIVNLHSLFNDFYDRGALKITRLTQQLGERERDRAPQKRSPGVMKVIVMKLEIT